MTSFPQALRAVSAVALVATGLAAAGACSGSSSDDAAPTSTAAPPTPATPLERLTVSYNDTTLDPSAGAWSALLADPDFATKPVAVAEFVRLNTDDAARDQYNAFLDVLEPAITASGGTLLSVNDTWRPGLEQPAGHEGGISWIADFPSISSYVDAMLDPAVVAAAERRREAVAEANVLLGPNLLPDVIKQLGPNDVASDFPSDRVQGKTPQQIVDELLTVYPSGGADPTAETLEAIAEYEGFEDQRVHFINLYVFNDAPGGGEASLGEYNTAALPIVLAHGARPKVLANVTHNLVGSTPWDRFIFVSWPSLAVFTDLRLDPGYIDAQKDRVQSADVYGNLITIARADQPHVEQ